MLKGGLVFFVKYPRFHHAKIQRLQITSADGPRHSRGRSPFLMKFMIEIRSERLSLKEAELQTQEESELQSSIVVFMVCLKDPVLFCSVFSLSSNYFSVKSYWEL